MSLGVSTAVGDLDKNNRGNSILCNEVVEDPGHDHVRVSLGTVVRNHKWGCGVRLVLCRNVDGDLSLVIDFVRVNDEGFGILRIDGAEHLPGNPRVINSGVL